MKAPWPRRRPGAGQGDHEGRRRRLRRRARDQGDDAELRELAPPRRHSRADRRDVGGRLTGRQHQQQGEDGAHDGTWMPIEYAADPCNCLFSSGCREGYVCDGDSGQCMIDCRLANCDPGTNCVDFCGDSQVCHPDTGLCVTDCRLIAGPLSCPQGQRCDDDTGICVADCLGEGEKFEDFDTAGKCCTGLKTASASGPTAPASFAPAAAPTTASAAWERTVATVPRTASVQRTARPTSARASPGATP